ncbi:MAG TPA: hypothetical protein DDZ51_23210 [Planctomycetaceae bacterium]|nr:hypothetical protein [Planctomycetaceae bacterium]
MIAEKGHTKTKLFMLLCLLFIEGCGKPSGRGDSTAPADTDHVANASGWSATQEDWFRDAEAIDYTYRSGRESGLYTILESVGGGVAVIDFDNDGDLDLVFAGGGTIDSVSVTGNPLAAYRNDRNWQFVNVTKQVGLDLPLDYSHGVTVCDFNRDGWPDLYVTTYGQSKLFLNNNGVFRDVTNECGLDFIGWSTGAVWFDANQDSWPDLFVIGYVQWKPESPPCINKVQDVCPPQRYPSAKDRLFINQGGSRFIEQSDAAGIASGGKGLGVVASDFNGDGFVDLYVANDAVENQLYYGKGDGTFQEVGNLAGVAVNAVGAPEGSMGVDFGDVDGDGRGDLWVTNFQFEDNSLYRNLNNKLFQHSTIAFGLGGTNRTNVGFGTGFVDFDLDGWLDLFVVNGHVRYLDDHPHRQKGTVYRNVPHSDLTAQTFLGRRFTDATAQSGEWFSKAHVGRGAAWGDLDGNGAQDLVVVCQDEPVALLANLNQPQHWIGLRLVGTLCDPNAVGSSVEFDHKGRTLTRWVTSGSSYLSQSDTTIHLPVEADLVAVSVRVKWIGGTTETFNGLSLNRVHKLVQGQGN